MKLRDTLPIEFMGCEYETCRARKFADVEIIEEYDSFKDPWIGKEKNVHYWFKLVNGYAVGHNENPARGWSFPVVKYI
jgi:hypothetical protein